MARAVRQALSDSLTASQFQTITPIDGEAAAGNTRYHGFNTIAAVLTNGDVAIVTDQAEGAVAVTRYTSAGAVIGERIYVARPAGFAEPEIAPLQNGGFVVTWVEYGFWPNSPIPGPHPGRTPFGHYVVYDAAGNAVASGERVHASVSATSLEGGGFALGWGIWDGTPHSETQVFDDAGVAQGPAASLSSDRAVTLFSGGYDGGYFAASNGGVRYMHGGSAGAVLAISIAVHDTAVLTDGRVVLVGGIYSSSNGQDVYSQIYDPASGTLSAATRVNITASGDQIAANVVALDGGRYLVTWQNDVAGVEDDPIIARQFLADGTGGDEFGFSSDIVGRKPDGTLIGTRMSFYPANGTDDILLEDYAVSTAAGGGAGAGGGGGDFNGDGKSDLLWQNDDGRAAAWLLNATDLMSSAVVGPNPGPSWHIVGTGDFDEDSRSDVVWQNNDGRVAIWFLNGVNLVGDGMIASNPGPSWHIIDTGHFNMDGKSDLLWQNDDGRVAVWTMNGTTQIGGGLVGENPGPSWHVEASGDFNGDGKSDILWQNDDGRAAVWLLDGMNFVRGAVVGENPGPSWHIKDSGDFNGDGKSDILWQNDDGRAAVWFLDGLSFVSGSVAGSNPGPLWDAEAAADYNGDGRSDILWQHDNGQAGIWLMVGFAVLDSNLVGSNPGATWHVDWI